MASSTNGCVVDWRCALVGAYSAYFAREVARGVSEVPTFAGFVGSPLVGATGGGEGHEGFGVDGSGWSCVGCGVTGRGFRGMVCGVDGSLASGTSGLSEPAVDGRAGLQGSGAEPTGGEASRSGDLTQLCAVGGGSVGGPNVLRNRKWRADSKEKKKKRQLAGDDWRKRDVVRAFPEAVDESWVARKNAENKLKEMRALRQIELLQAGDVEDEKKRRRTRVLEQTERSKVNIERAYMSLRAAGNVAGLPGGGSAETVLTGATVEGVPGLGPGDGSISPSSSASWQEFRAVQKQNLDLAAEVAELKDRERRRERELRLNFGENVSVWRDSAGEVEGSARELIKVDDFYDVEFLSDLPDLGEGCAADELPTVGRRKVYIRKVPRLDLAE